MDSSLKNNAVVHFEMPYDDAKRLAEFYKNSFGWDMQVMGEPWGGYVMAMTGPSDQNGPTASGYINGGFYDSKQSGVRTTTIVIQVQNLEETIEKVKSAGGEVLGEKMNIPKVGLYVAVSDSEGNRVGVLQPVPMT